MVRKVLLVCGIFSSLLYVAMNVFVAMLWASYNSASQTVSELSAIGAPTRPLWVSLGVAYTLLVAAFGCGVWSSARQPPTARRRRLDVGLRCHRHHLALCTDAPPRGRDNADRHHAHRA